MRELVRVAHVDQASGGDVLLNLAFKRRVPRLDDVLPQIRRAS